MTARAKPHATGKTKPGDVSERVGVEQIRSRGVNVEQLLEKLIDAAGAEFTTYYYYTILRMYLAGHEDYKEICEDARLEDRAPVQPGDGEAQAISTQLPDPRLARGPLAETLQLRVMEYVRAHLAERDLTAARIAAKHHISVRHLYNILASSGISLGDWVRAQRLEECRKDLAKPGANSVTIAFIGQRWGFPDATNFGRAFKAAYGMSPREWRDLHSASPN